jgi:hypothetical protein
MNIQHLKNKINHLNILLGNAISQGDISAIETLTEEIEELKVLIKSFENESNLNNNN